MKQSHLFAVAGAVLSLALFASFAHAEKAAAKTITGKSACSTCDGMPVKGHAIYVVAEDGTRWVLVADKESTKGFAEAHKVRKEHKTMTATLAGEPVTKKDDAGKEYKEVKVSEIKIG